MCGRGYLSNVTESFKCMLLKFTIYGIWVLRCECEQARTGSLCQKASIHQVTTMLATSKNVLFPGHNHLLTTSTDDPALWLSPEHQWAKCYDLELGHFLEMASMVVTWWILFFFSQWFFILPDIHHCWKHGVKSLPSIFTHWPVVGHGALDIWFIWTLLPCTCCMLFHFLLSNMAQLREIS